MHGIQESQGNSRAGRPWISRRLKFMPRREAVIAAGLRVLPIWTVYLLCFAVNDERLVLANELFPWTGDLAQNWTVIRDEAQALLGDRMSVPSIRELSRDHEKIAVDEKWRSFFFWGYGLRSEANLRALYPRDGADTRSDCGPAHRFIFRDAGRRAWLPRHSGPTKSHSHRAYGFDHPQGAQGLPDAGRRSRDRVGGGRHRGFRRHVSSRSLERHRGGPHHHRIASHQKRPLRFPGSLLRDFLFAALRASPFVRDGLRNMEALEQVKGRPRRRLVGLRLAIAGCGGDEAWRQTADTRDSYQRLSEPDILVGVHRLWLRRFGLGPLQRVVPPAHPVRQGRCCRGDQQFHFGFRAHAIETGFYRRGAGAAVAGLGSAAAGAKGWTITAHSTSEPTASPDAPHGFGRHHSMAPRLLPKPVARRLVDGRRRNGVNASPDEAIRCCFCPAFDGYVLAAQAPISALAADDPVDASPPIRPIWRPTQKDGVVSAVQRIAISAALRKGFDRRPKPR